jgi:hypothetical protein
LKQSEDYKKMEDLLKQHFSSLIKSESGLMNTKLRDALCKEAEKLFKGVYFYKLPLASMSTENAIDVVINEISQSATYAYNIEQHRDRVKNTQWSPTVEFEVLRDSTEFHILILKSLGFAWRNAIQHDALPVLIGQPLQLRETMKEFELDDFSLLADEFNEHSVWTRSGSAWTRLNTEESLSEPLEFKDALLFQNCPSSKNILALFPTSVKLGRLGGKVFGEFAHDIATPNFLDCFVLSTGTIIVKIGERNLLTGGLKDEMSFSFRYGKSDFDCVPYSLSKEEENEIQSYYQDHRSMRDMTCAFSAVNSCEEKAYIVNDFKKYKQSEDGIICGIVGNKSGYALAFCHGKVKTHCGWYTLKAPITHILYLD